MLLLLILCHEKYFLLLFMIHITQHTHTVITNKGDDVLIYTGMFDRFSVPSLFVKKMMSRERSTHYLLPLRKRKTPQLEVTSVLRGSRSTWKSSSRSMVI